MFFSQSITRRFNISTEDVLGRHKSGAVRRPGATDQCGTNTEHSTSSPSSTMTPGNSDRQRVRRLQQPQDDDSGKLQTFIHINDHQLHNDDN